MHSKPNPAVRHQEVPATYGSQYPHNREHEIFLLGSHCQNEYKYDLLSSPQVIIEGRVCAYRLWAIRHHDGKGGQSATVRSYSSGGQMLWILSRH